MKLCDKKIQCYYYSTMNIILIAIVQSIYSVSDLWKKIALGNRGFRWSILTDPLFLVGLTVPLIAFALQMYVFSRYELSRTITIMGVCAVVFSMTLGILFLKERYTAINYLGVLFAILAIILIRYRTTP